MYQIILAGDGSVIVTEVMDMSISGERFSKTTYVSEENMPDDLHTKLSMLKLLTPPDEYEQVGYRIDDDTFWIND